MSDEERLQRLDIRRNQVFEQALLNVGEQLYSALVEVVRYEEVELLLEMIGPYTEVVSVYSVKTAGFQESLGVNLNEAALLKASALRNTGKSMEWKYYADDFIQEVRQLASELQ